MSAQNILALDFGGTKHSAACLAPGETDWRAHLRTYSGPGSNAERDLSVMISLAEAIMNGQTPLAVGVSFGGPVNFTTGVVRLSHHVPGWENLPLAALLEREFNAPVVVDNDANTAALGEAYYGSGKGFDSLFYITVSTGVGGGWILHGQPWRGHESLAGEIGHTIADARGPVCLCGKRGCVERLASGPYIAQDIKGRLQEHPNKRSIILRLAGNDPHQINARIVAEAASQGDPLAREMLERAGWAVGVGIGNTANLINPEMFILGGGVTKAGDIFWNAIKRSAKETALPEINFDIVPASLGDDSPLWGAVRLAELARTE